MAARACVSTQGAAAFTQRLMVVRLHFPNWCWPLPALNEMRRVQAEWGMNRLDSIERNQGKPETRNALFQAAC